MTHLNHTEKIDKTAPKSLFLATIAFAIAFANWGLIAGLAPLLKKELSLSPAQASLMIAIPVLLGSLGRIPAGIFTDRFGARKVFSILLAFALIPAIALALNHSYPSLLFWGFFLGIAGSSFAIGIAFVSRWYPPKYQGMACGIYGAGNIGQSFAVFAGPVLASFMGISNTFILFGLISLAWAVIFALTAKNPPVKARPKTFQECFQVLRTEKLTWALSLFYSLTFGGFVALSIYLPTLLQDLFDLTPADAGARTALFVIIATLCRPVGGWLSDRLGGATLLLGVFLGIVVTGWLMAIISILPLVDCPCETDVEIANYRQMVHQKVAEHGGDRPKDLPLDPNPEWHNGELIPPTVQEQSSQLNVTLTLQQWASLTPLQRFALIKLSRSNHENRNFLPALKEFHLV